MTNVCIAPSLLSCDFANIESELGKISTADWAHIDVMDNHFVPNLTWGLPVVERIVQVSPLPVDVHLMIAEPDRWAPAYAEVGCHNVTFHAEAAAAPIGLARDLRAKGAKASMAIKPGTPVSAIQDILPELDMLLVMTVEPGFGGQKFLDMCLPKIREARKLVSEQGLSLHIEVDGGVSAETVERCAEAGADTFVAGSAVYGAESAMQAISQLRNLADAAISSDHG